ncbi:FtsX-like permease family protein [Pseudothauera nasutitermitis]|uniref:FtsX-like permease family protein n=1 Tax=Pseudothauera nasutitermitis TaxID=2565930 RepID=A0A4S4B1I8_9RHOO|nr:FtsX-like permease family protein [Pseudothauera nasutitermitis]THF66404.1 FtsX-like permease family protein [Pseudothauera nasutitermitis]
MNTLRLAYRMMLRDLRAGELHLLGLAILIAVASLTSVGFLADRVGRGLDREANQLLGGDLLLRADHPWSTSFTDEARRLGLETTGTTLFTSMASTEERAVLAGVKAVEEGYPLRGAVRIALAPNEPGVDAGRVPERGEVWLDERLFADLGVRVGDLVGLGLVEFRVGGMITFESDRGANFFSLLPRAIFNAADLPATGLLVEGSRATWRLHLAGTAEAVAGFESWARANLGRGEAVETIENARPEVRAALDRAQRFLRLAALLAVILAAVAVGLSSRRFMRRHLDGCAVMRCLGAGQGQVLRLFVGEFLLLGLAAAAAGSALGWLIQFGLATVIAGVVATSLPAPSLLPLAHGVAVGLVLLVGFALPQLLRLGAVPTLRVLRRELGGVEPVSGAAWVAGVVALIAIVLWIAADLRLGAMVAGGFGAALGVFALAARGALGLAARLRAGGPAGGWRYGLAALGRRMGGSVIQATALGVGLTALLLLTLIRADLLDNWRQATSADAPNRFIINIQPDQRDGILAQFREAGLAEAELQPMIRGRLTAINGAPIDPDGYEDDRARRLVEREFNLSYGTRLPSGNELVGGQWHGDAATPQFSIEEGLAQTFGLKIGDEVSFEIAGRAVSAPITSVRKLDWDSMRVNFFFIASPGVLEEHPASMITSFHLPPEQNGFISRLVHAYPNLTVIDIGAVLAQVREIMDKLILVVQFVFGFALAAGVVVLYAALQSTHDEREYELAMLRTLGARDRQVRHALVAEFAVLGAVAGALAGIGASAIGWVLAEQVFRMAYLPGLLPLFGGAVLGALGVLAGGWLGVRGLLARPPLASLRALG